MSRLPVVIFEELSSEQQRIYKLIAGNRQVFNGPFTAWIRNPELAERMQDLSNLLRYQSTLDKRHLELMILVVARHTDANYMWCIHEPYALEAGISEAVVESIKNKRPFEFDKLIYDIVIEVLESNSLVQTTYDRALAALGIDKLIELATVTGFYVMISVVLNVFDVPPLPNKPSLF